jgi:hypothetical protein
MTVKISDYTALTSAASGDLLEIVDISDTTMAATGTNKKIVLSDLLASVLPLAGGTMTGVLQLATGTKSAPSLVLSAAGTGTGWFNRAGTGYWMFGAAGAEMIQITSGYFHLAAIVGFIPRASSLDAVAPDVGIGYNSAGVLEVNNSNINTYRDILVRSIIIDGAPSTAGAGQIAIGADTRTTIGANGGASALTALPVGYIDINVAGSSYQIPYYSRGA